MMKNDFLENALKSLEDFTKLKQAGVSDEQALRIAFCDDVAKKTITQIENLKMSEKIKR